MIANRDKAGESHVEMVEHKTVLSYGTVGRFIPAGTLVAMEKYLQVLCVLGRLNRGVFGCCPLRQIARTSTRRCVSTCLVLSGSQPQGFRASTRQRVRVYKYQDVRASWFHVGMAAEP